MQAVADHLETHLAAALNQQPFKPLGLATGRTMEPLYRELVRRLSQWPEQRLAQLRGCWSSFNLDEYVGLASSDPRSFAFYMQSQLGGPLQLPASQLRLPDGMAADPADEACAIAPICTALGASGCSCWASVAMDMWASTNRLPPPTRFAVW